MINLYFMVLLFGISIGLALAVLMAIFIPILYKILKWKLKENKDE